MKKSSKRKIHFKKYLVIEHYYSILRRDWRISTLPIDVVMKTIAYIVVSVDRFIKDDCSISASALTFYSTLAFIPVVALILAIARGFGAGKILEEWAQEQAYTNPQVTEWVMGFANKALENTQGGILAGLGIVILIWSVIRMLSSTELTMNRIWGVKKGRKIAKKFTDYISILFIAPILIIIISSANVFMNSNIQEFATEEGLLGIAGTAIEGILTLVPYVLVWFLFVFLYMFMPTTPVRFKYALISGIIAGTVFQIVQWFYLRFQIGVSSYNAIYGGLAAIPLLLVWLQLSWSIVLWGVELCYIMRNRHFLYRNAMNIDNRWVDNVDISVRILKHVSTQYMCGHGSPTLSDVCKKLRMSTSKVRMVIEELVDMNVLIEVKDEDDVSFYPAMDFRQLSMAQLINHLSFMDKNKGEHWKLRFVEAINKEFAGDKFAE